MIISGYTAATWTAQAAMMTSRLMCLSYSLIVKHDAEFFFRYLPSRDSRMIVLVLI